ncbi:MAG: GTP 3',8-cyclase MoaA [Gammaproteobacteria bacterium]|nr:GTP 3',8-cyclase MoaA [Gammaproteobacteria bacterium]
MDILKAQDTNLLIDKFGRQVTYVRLSITDRCDFRCQYCMSEDMKFLPREKLLTLEEMSLLGETFASLGVNKIRITGGEPLVRKNIMLLFQRLGKIDSIKDLTLTTNGSQLAKYASELKNAGVTRINISLDSLQENRFHDITRTGNLYQVLGGIDAAIEAGFRQIKLNAVIMKNHNHDEILDLTEFVVNRGIDISFIEEMPLGSVSSHDRDKTYYSSDDVKSDIEKRFLLTSSAKTSAGPSRYYDIEGTESSVGFISPHSHNFCESCNRVRVTAEGRLLLCLGQEHSVDLRDTMRRYPGDADMLRTTLIESMHIKPEGHDFNTDGGVPVILRHMNMTGG